MSKKTFGFAKQLNIGNAGEAYFKLKYQDLKPEKAIVRAFDFVLGDGKTVELKTDQYPMGKSNNFFVELYSCMHTKKLGGPFRAAKDNVDLFVYYYFNDRVFFWFDAKTFCERATQIIAEKKPQKKIIPNHGYSTLGYAIPRALFKDIIVREDIFVD